MRFSGDNLRKLREAKRWDQHRLAQEARVHGKSGITQAAVSRHENGMQATTRNATAYAKALGCSVTDLYELDDEDEEAASMPLHELAQDLAAAIDRIVDARVQALGVRA